MYTKCIQISIFKKMIKRLFNSENFWCGKFIVLKLMEFFTGYGRNVILENFFTSVSLAIKWKQKELLLLESFIEINKNYLII